ncbi:MULTISPECIES: hypothetical protein [Bacteroides]|uniref:hypothetical protein n=1 Tax=Bacteroides TaxID=816 RepID=UPI001B3C5AE4|nr:hypothetical protein [Bacteroides sp. 1001302B_160321_D4]
MKKNFVRVMLFGALTLTVSTVVTSCKDYDDDIKGLQEQVDKITSTSPVSTEDMKNAVEKAKQDLQTQLNDLSALVENPDGEKTLKEKIAALEQALADATGDKAKDLATRLADLQNQLTTLQKILKGEDGVSGLEKKIEELENVKTVLSELIAAEQAYITSGKKDASAYESTSFGAYVNQAIINALQHEGDDTSKWGKIAQYVTEAVQKGISTELSGINNYLTAQYGVKTTLETFVKDVYEKLFSEEAIGKQTQLDNLLDAINAYVSTEEDADYKSYADIIKQIDDTKKQLAALELPATGTFSQAVKDIIKSESEQVGGVIKGLESRLDAEIKAIKGMIQSIVYIPESADRTVNFNTFYVKYGTNNEPADWSPVLNANEVKVNFRVSPQSAVAELIKGEEGKYLIAADYHQLTRATGTHFAIKKIEAVTGESNVIAVTLDASTADKSYAVALTVKDKGETTLNDITSDYFAAVKENMYIEEVQWESVNAAASEVAKNASIDYKATGSYYKMTVKSSINAGTGATEGQALTKTKPEEFGISVDNLFSVTFGVTGAGTSSFTMNGETGVLKGNADGTLGDNCQATSTVKAKAPAGVTGDKSFTQKTYSGTVTLIDIQAPTTIELADPDASLVWHSTKQELALNTEKVTALRTALGGIGNFSGCTFERIAPADAAPASATPVTIPDIKFNKDAGNNLVLEVPAGATYTGKVTTKITNTAGHISIVLSTDIDIKYPAEADLTLANSNAWDGTKAVLNLKETGSSPITAVTAERDLTELFSNYKDLIGENGNDGTLTSLGGEFEFSVVGETPTGVTLNATSGALSVTNRYPVGGAGFSVKVEAKCGEKVISTKTIPVVFNTAKMNGTFDYKVDTEDKDKLAFDVSSAAERGNGVDVSSALVWKDASATPRQLWPSSGASSDYQDSNGAKVFGFTVAFELVAGEDNDNFALDGTTGKLTLKNPDATQNHKAMTVKVKAIPTSPWGTVEAKVVTVTVAEWVD